jgi:hypothetical protein
MSETRKKQEAMTTSMKITMTPERVTLGEISSALQRLHKALLDAERIQYERAFGRVESEFQLLHLAAEDPQFAWLRPMATMILRLDERRGGEGPVTAGDVKRVSESVRALLVPNATGDTFQRLYHHALQDDPNVVMAHAGVMRTLPPVRSGADGEEGTR